MLGLLSQPKPQRADETIVTLCDRLSNSLLLEDRKAAVLSLRGLAHDSRELVASAGLRGLLDTLIKDSHDAETARPTLETLLILFSPETRRRRVRRYVSPLIRAEIQPDDFAANDISLWLADELLHNDEALACVLALAATKNDPFTAVYALQLVSAMTANRPAETKQAMLASGGISTIAAALGSAQDMVRDEALLLLGALTADHLDLQKLVVFEGGLDRVFAVLNDAGGVVFGGRLAEDCLSLLANLLQYNTSNQVLFTQSGYVKQWVGLLAQIRDTGEDDAVLGEQAVTNIVAALQIGQLLTVADAERTTENQNLLNADGALRTVLEIAFGSASALPVRVAALVTIASLVDANTSQQNELLAIDVPYYDMTLRKVVMIEPVSVPVAQGLLNWALALSSTHLFDLRAASLLCLTASLRGNQHAKETFIQDQINLYRKQAQTPSHSENSSENANLIETLAEYSDENRLNPFRIWFAAALIMHIFVDSPESKELLQAVTIGDESLGMDVHGFIQAIAGEMQGVLSAADSTAALGYLQLLTVWFYDNPEAVSEFTAETSAIQALLAHQDVDPLIQSLSAIVLGTAYAFCSSQSKLPRKDFHQLLTKSLGRDHYLLLMRKFRTSTVFQNFDEADIFGAPRGPNGIPAVYLDAVFVDLMRESLGRISRAIDADPNIEPSARVSFEMVEDLNMKLHEKTQALSKTTNELSVLNEELKQLRHDHAELKAKFESSEESRSEISAKLAETEAQIESLTKQLAESESQGKASTQSLESVNGELAALKAQHSKSTTEAQTLRAAKDKLEEGINKMTRELIQLQKSKDSLEKEAKKLQSENSKINPKLVSSQRAEKELAEKLRTLEKQTAEDSKSTKQLREVNDKLVQKLKETAETLKEYETREKSLTTQLTTIKNNAEDMQNELRSVQNRESQARKEAKLANEKVASLQKSEAQTGELQIELENLKSKSADLEGELAKAKEKNEELEKVLGKTRAKSKDLENDFEESKTKSEQLAKDFKTSKAKSGELEKELEKSKLKNQELAKELENSIAKSDKIQNQVGSSNDKEDSKELKAAQSTISELTAANQKLKESELTAKRASAAELEVANKTISELRSETEKVKSLEVTVEELKTENKKLQSDKKSSAESSKNKLKEELDEKQKALEELMVLLDDLTERKGLYKERLRSLKEEVSESEEEDDDDDDDDEDEEGADETKQANGNK